MEAAKELRNRVDVVPSCISHCINMAVSFDSSWKSRGFNPNVGFGTVINACTKRYYSSHCWTIYKELSKRLKVKGISISHMSVHRYLTNVIGAKSSKRPVKPRLTDKQKANRVSFCKERKYWTVDDWRRILFSDESPFEIFHTPNRQNDRIWAKNNLTLLPQEKVKFPSKLHVWGMISYCALSDLHIIPVGSTVTTKYYVEEILTKSLCLLSKENEKLDQSWYDNFSQTCSIIFSNRMELQHIMQK